MAKTENVKKFFEEVSRNEDLQKQLQAAVEKSSAEISNAIKAKAEKVVEVAKKKAGFDFTAQELLDSSSPEGNKLDKNELDAVVGGVWFCTAPGNCPATGYFFV